MANFKKTTVAGPRTELHETLGLTGCEEFQEDYGSRPTY